ncbi:MAG: translocation/assembly module TamB domain-containing protein [Chthoniobacteraceae bacterium]
MPDSAPSEAHSQAPHRSRAKWGRLLWRGGLLATVLLLVFHQIILRAVLWNAVVRLAARYQVVITGELRGSVWTHLTLQDIHAVSNGAIPFDSIDVDRLRLEYSLWALVRRGPARALTYYNLRNARLQLAPVRSSTDEEKKLAHFLRNILQQPAMYSDRAQIENFNLSIRTRHGMFVWNDIHALLDPDREGYIRIGELDLPGFGSWHGLRTKATYVNRHLVLREFDIGKEIHGVRMDFDASRRDQGVSSFSFEGTVLGGDLGVFIWGRDLSGENRRVQVNAYLGNLPLGTLGRHFGWKVPLSGPLREAWVSLEGDPRNPAAWEGDVVFNTENATVGALALDEASGRFLLKGGRVRLQGIKASTGANRLAFDGEYQLPTKWAEVRINGLRGTFDLNASDLARLDPHLTGGSVEAWGSLRVDGESLLLEGSGNAVNLAGAEFGLKQASVGFSASRPLGPVNADHPWHEGLGGGLWLDAGDVYFRQFLARQIRLELPLEKGLLRLKEGLLDLNGHDKLTASGWLALDQPHAYEASLKGSVEDISLFQPFFQTPIGGALDIDWHGSGSIAAMRHQGEGRVTLRHGFWRKFTGVDGELAGSYSPESVEITALKLASDQGTLQAGVRLHNERLYVNDLRLTVGGQTTVSGSLSFPLDLRTPTDPATLLPPLEPIEAALTLEAVDLAKRFPASRPGLAVRGALQGTFKAAGTLSEPDLTAQFDARNLQSGAAEKLPPAAGSALITYKEGRLAISGSLAQPGLSPLLFKGSMPADLRQLIRERKLDPQAPIAGSIKLPPSPAGIFAPFLPGVRYLEGRMSVDANARGTLAHPVLSGGVAMDLGAIRFSSPDVPGIDRLLCDLRFNGNELTFQRFSGAIAGGPFSVTGKVKLEPLTNPQLDLRLQSQGTLLVRNDTLTFRSNADLRFTGPLGTVNVSGRLGINKSRFFRQVEILPIGLPGRPAPKPALGAYQFSTTVTPFRDWTYNVIIQTDEPFVIKGNMADGALRAHLRLGGSGLAPTLDGVAWVDNLVASLPFSTLNVDHGALYFSGNASLNPTLDIHGSSRIRDYNVNVYLYGTALEPQTLFTSEPALPQEEVVTLLATGATTRDFQQNNQAATGRAAALLFQDIYRKVFPRRTAPSNSANPFDWFSLDVGGVDPRTGKQELMGKLKLSNAYQIGAGVDMQGDMRMQLQYLIRFR